jgi:aldose 1-epimerase
MKSILTAATVALISTSALSLAAQTTVKKEAWGKTASGQPVEIYTLTDQTLTIRVTTFGARLVSVMAPDRKGNKADVVLGHSDVQQYEKERTTYYGAIVGRYGNRIAHGKFTIDGHTYQIPVVNNAPALHGGQEGFDRKVWTATQIPNGVELTLVSPDNDQGFPGKLTAHVKYTLEGKSVRIDYTATTDRATVVNLTNHSYFNLGGESNGSILNEKLTLNADRYTPVDSTLIPTGELAPVEGTPFDFRKSTSIGARIDQKNDQLKIAGGYDHNYVLNRKPGTGLQEAAMVVDPASGRTLTVTTTQPGVQFYSGNFLDGTSTGPTGTKYAKHAGFCLETQHYPDSPNQPKFPSTVLKPGETMHSTTVFTFGVVQGQ